MKKFIYMIAVLLAAISCSYDHMKLQQPEELGTAEDSYVIEAEGGSVKVVVYANMEGDAYLEGNPTWAEVSDAHFTSDHIVTVTASQNTGRARMAKLVLKTAVRKDTVIIKQHGITEEHLSIPSTTAVVIKDSEEMVEIPVSTNADPAYVTFRIDYESADNKWI